MGRGARGETRRRAQAAAAALASSDAAVGAVRAVRRRRLLHRAHPRNIQVYVVGALIRYEDYSHSPHLARARARLALAASTESTTATTGPRPFAHREYLVCALRRAPGIATASSANTLHAQRRRAARAPRVHPLPADAPAAVRGALPLLRRAALVRRRALLENIGTAEQLPQHLACLETGRIQLQLQLSEYAHLSAMRAYFSRAQHLEQHRRHRPPLGRRPLGHAREWWRYAIGAVRWQVRLEREPYTWGSVKRRGAVRRGFVKLHQKCLRKGGVKGLSEGERVSLRQLADSLDAESQLLYEQLAEAALAGEADSPGGLFRRQSSAFVYEVHTERKMELSAEQRAAAAELLDGVDEKPGLHERLSLHARLLVAEVVFTLHAPGATPPLKLQATLANVGLNAGVSVGAYADVFAEGFSMTLVRRRRRAAPCPSSRRHRRRRRRRRHRGGSTSPSTAAASSARRALRRRCPRSADAPTTPTPRRDGRASRAGGGRRGRGRGRGARRAPSRCSGSRRSGSTSSPTTRRPPSRRSSSAASAPPSPPSTPPPSARCAAARRAEEEGQKGQEGRGGGGARPPRGCSPVEASATPPPSSSSAMGRVAVPFEPRLVLTADRVGVSGGVGADAAGGVASLQLSLELEALQLCLTRLRGWLPRAALPDAPLERRASRLLSEEGQKQAEAERERLMARRGSLEAEVMTAMFRKAAGARSASAAEE